MFLENTYLYNCTKTSLYRQSCLDFYFDGIIQRTNAFLFHIRAMDFTEYRCFKTSLPKIEGNSNFYNAIEINKLM